MQQLRYDLGDPRFEFRQERKIYSSYKALRLTAVPNHTLLIVSVFEGKAVGE
jgi:hypothetical protein